MLACKHLSKEPQSCGMKDIRRVKGQILSISSDAFYLWQASCVPAMSTLNSFRKGEEEELDLCCQAGDVDQE